MSPRAPSIWDRPGALGRLGNEADQRIADDLGITRAAVAAKRVRLGIPSAGVPTGPKPRGLSSGRDLKIRLTDEERTELEAAAGGEPLSTWGRDVMLAEARRSR